MLAVWLCMKHSSLRSLSNQTTLFVGQRNKCMFHNLNLLQNLHGEIFLPHAKVLIAWIPIEMTGIC